MFQPGVSLLKTCEYIFVKDLHLKEEGLTVEYVKTIHSRIKMLADEVFKTLEGVVKYDD